MLRGGAGLFYTPVPLNVAVFDQLQSRTITQYDADGVTPIGTRTLRNTVGSALHTPRSVNVTAELDRELAKNFFVRLSAQQRKTEFEPILDVASSSIVLQTDGNSRYREGQVTARYQFHGQDQIVGSYTRSSAVGDLNDYNSFYGAIQNPIIRPNQRGPLPWDAPNHSLFWSNLSLPREVLLERNLAFHEDWANIGHEDIELGYRWTQAGYDVIYNPKAWGEHFHPHDLDSACRLQLGGPGPRDSEQPQPRLARYHQQVAALARRNIFDL
jgi:hypothetical protein